MVNVIQQLDRASLGILQDVSAIADGKNVASYVIGGCVRDLILRRKIVDLDIAIDGDAQLIAKTFAGKYQGRCVVHPQFLTANVTLQDGRCVDFTTLRKESYPRSGVLPTVSVSGLRDDLFRRDFTINAMAMSLSSRDFGRLIDEFGGYADLKAKKIRILHDQSFMDDPTRILRAVRFAVRFSFVIEPKTVRLIRKAIKQGGVGNVKPMRMYEEFKKNLAEDRLDLNLQWLAELGFIKRAWGIGLTQRQKDLIVLLSRLRKWVNKNLKDADQINFPQIVWMVLFSRLSQLQMSKSFEILSFAKSEQVVIRQAYVDALQLRRKDFSSWSQSRKILFIRQHTLEVLLYWLLILDDLPLKTMIRSYLLKWRNITLQITGNDLEAMGVPSGEVYRFILDDVWCCVVQGKCRNQKEQVQRASRLFQQLSCKE